MSKQSLVRNILWAVGGVIVIVLAYGVFVRLVSPQPPDFSHSTLAIRRANGTSISLNIEVATTPAQKAYGLMFRRLLPPDTGMIFVWDTDQPVDFWMKNTYIPLDMLFVRGDGTIVKIVTHAVPLTLTPIPSGEPVRYVIEINAGAAAKLGISTGDKVVFSGFAASP